MDVIAEEVVVLVQRDKTVRPLKLKKGRKLHLEKLSFFADGALGHNYGSCFEVDKQQLVPLQQPEKKQQSVQVGDEDASGGSGNRNIFDDGSSQELTEQDITHMKGQGASGLEIVESMIEHSSSFKERSKFSQEKYIRKKEKKYIPVIKILKTTTKLLCDHYHEKAPAKICHMRSDSLAQILTLSNVHAHSNMIVMETCQGLVAGSMLERMGGFGKLVQVFYGDFPVRIILDNFGHLSDSDKGILMKYPLHRVGTCLLAKHKQCWSSVLEEMGFSAGVNDETQSSASKGKVTMDEDSECVAIQQSDPSSPPAKKLKIEQESSKQPQQDVQPQQDEEQMTVEQEHHPQPALNLEESSNEYDSASEGVSVMEVTTAGSCSSELRVETKERKERKLMKEEAYKQAEELLKQRKMDGLVIACRFLPEPILMSLVNFVAPSRPIVVYCQLLEPLVQCYKSLKKSGIAFNIQITDTWLRHYQVLPERTHPEMSMDGHSGFILTATKIKRDTI